MESSYLVKFRHLVNLSQNSMFYVALAEVKHYFRQGPGVEYQSPNKW